VIDIVCLVDGSDSYNNKVSVGGKIEEGDAFYETNRLISEDLVPGLAQALGGRATFTLIQFSGVKQLEKSYTPGKDGETGTAGLKHYNIECPPTYLSDGYSSKFKFQDTCEGLDGNGQLFLAVQDINMDGFLNRLTKATPSLKMAKDQSRKRILIIFSDEEWDVKHLDNSFGSGKTDANTVAAKNAENYETYACIVRPNMDADQNEDFIIGKLCNGQSNNYKKVYTSKFDVQCKSAISSIISDLKSKRN